MKTPEEFLLKYGICSDTTIGVEGDKMLTELIEEYANQALCIHDVVGRSEQLKALLEKLLENNMCSHAGDKLIEEALKGF